MAKKTPFDLPALVDAFVRKINSDPREPQRVDEVPEFLRESAAEDLASETTDGWTSWRVVRRDNSTRIEQLEKLTGRSCPPSFQYLLTNPERVEHLWVHSSLAQKQRLQQVFFPDGIRFDGKKLVGTGITLPVFNYLNPISGAEKNLVDQICASSNPLISWLGK